MKSKIRVLFESLISCGKPTKVLFEPGDDKDQGPLVIDEPENIAQEQGQDHQQVVKDEMKHTQGQEHVVIDEPENAHLVQGEMVKNEAQRAKEQVEGAFVYRAHITTYRRITISSRQAKPPPRRPPPPPQTGKIPNK